MCLFFYKTLHNFRQGREKSLRRWYRMAGNITQCLKKGRGTALGVRRRDPAGQALC